MRHRRPIAVVLFAILAVAASCEQRAKPAAPAGSAAPSAPSATSTPTIPEPSPVVTAPPKPVAPAEAPGAATPSAPATPQTTPPAAPTTAPLSENQKIEKMLTLLAESDAVFIRNGVDYDGKAAAAHLRSKWSTAGSRIKTANDFIDGLASKSSTSGKPYQVRKKDGSTVLAGDWFRQLLAQIEAGR
ncbi:MAG: DUF5329 family protein [Phycisphaerales bacterium]